MADRKRTRSIEMDAEGNVLLPTKDEVATGLFDTIPDPFDASTLTQHFPIGTRLVQGDREFTYVRAGAVALVPGFTVQTAASLSAGHDMDMVTAAAAVGLKTVTITPATVSLTANQYKDGYLFVNDLTGEGQIYKIKSNPAITFTETGVLTLYDPVTVALDATTLTGIRRNPFADVIVSPTTLTGAVIGVAHRPITALYYGWIQTRGLANIRTVGTLVIGQNAIAPTATTAGCVGPEGAAGLSQVVGITVNVSVTTDYSLVMLTLP